MTSDLDAVSADSGAELKVIAARLSKGYMTVGEMAYQVIKDAVMAGVFPPGTRLRQEYLASGIGVSRLPVRSALIQLESEGLVTFHPRRGATVRSVTVERVREIYEIRCVLEPFALSKSMATMTTHRLLRLRELASELDEPHTPSTIVASRTEFYRELYDAAGNPELIKIIEELHSSVGRFMLGWQDLDEHRSSHDQLVTIVGEGDVERARESLLAHLTSVRKAIERVLIMSITSGSQASSA